MAGGQCTTWFRSRTWFFIAPVQPATGLFSICGTTRDELEWITRGMRRYLPVQCERFRDAVTLLGCDPGSTVVLPINQL